ncbi:KTSC domain-containing protein [Klebsiella pneumoniae]|uniref:KTSC domain-containing protein n=1 Tax=Klebsiella pneumoniae TaxID=573 RepID=UPI00202DD8BB|nr:KTSC domain-containing protein [Klebsiella pneumoniae]MCM1583250.1 KTSC domain-containing protein [Klebsiella pneumoniae]URT73765.1 KTSC domain-containing protein [Klebsiella pneumoniae]HDU1485524.1 KTSC domain-containing protein [Klebsiella pneumoniae]
MHHHPVKSSRIISVAYDDASATLEIYFYHQPPLQYTGVPPRIFHDFLQVVSKGRYNDGVIKGKFPERKLR